MSLNRFFVLALISINCGLSAGTIQGKVVGVADGDTITVLDAKNTQHKIRLQGIDAPEKAQAYGQRSKQSLHQLIHGMQVDVEFQKKDKYGRTVGKVMHGGTDICLEQINLGMAWHYKKYESAQPKEERNTYAQAEISARTKSIGIWTDKNPTSPWEFRRLQK